MKLSELYRQKREEYEALTKAHPETMPADVFEKGEAILADCAQLKKRIENEIVMEAGKAFLEDPANTPRAASAQWIKDTTRPEDEPTIDKKAWREVKVNTQYGEVARRFHVPLEVQGKHYDDVFDKWVRARGNLTGFSEPERKALSEGSDADGGFWVPADIINRVIMEETKVNAVRSLATVINTGRDIMEMTRYLDGSMNAKWLGEIEAATLGSPKIKRVSIHMNKMGSEIIVSNDLLMDSSIDINSLLAKKISEGFAILENAAYINGDGVGKPYGILADVDGDGPESINSGSNSAVQADELVLVYGALDEPYEPNAKWLMSKATQIAIELLVDNAGRYMINPLASGSLQTPLQANIRGFQIFRDSAMPAISQDKYPIIFGDFSAYTIIDRVGLSIKFDQSNYVSTDQTQIVARKRTGGDLLEPYKLKVQKIHT